MYALYGKVCSERRWPVISQTHHAMTVLWSKYKPDKIPCRRACGHGLPSMCMCVCVCPLQAQMHMKNKYLVWNMKMLANETGHTASAAIKNYAIFPLRSPKISANFAWERGKLHSNGFFFGLLFVLLVKVLTDHSGPFVSCFFSC